MAADKVDLRGLAPRELAEALDALALAESMDRNSLVNRVLHEYVTREVRKMTVAQRALRGNAYLSESRGRDSE